MSVMQVILRTAKITMWTRLLLYLVVYMPCVAVKAGSSVYHGIAILHCTLEGTLDGMVHCVLGKPARCIKSHNATGIFTLVRTGHGS